jgi:hypothetical protein
MTSVVYTAVADKRIRNIGAVIAFPLWPERHILAYL